ncbi:hypothetical protein [Bordetella petrii]|uniref:hypothetical protein n=1 Tax=Bordetella petrii TaxID=94624 RepID=UPI001E3BBDCD|nr:hypothetical protein [Bordetella petrii]MCD0501503.1 hypothetical protein [Bordetella petrii]
MTDPYKNIPNVLPGSNAAQAVDEINHYIQTQGSNLTPAALEQAIKQKIVQYGGDPVTAAAASRTASVLVEQDPARASMIAENVVGATLADPALASNLAKDRVNAHLDGLGADAGQLTDEQKKSIAFNEANGVLQDWGVTDTQSSQALQEAVNQYIDQGASPDVAAAAAVASVLAQAMPGVGSFSIFGHLSMLVHGEATYIFNSTETLDVADTAVHTHLNGTKYDMANNTLGIYCEDIKTSNRTAWVRAHPGAAFGYYRGSYFSWSPVTLSGYVWSKQRGVEQRAIGGFSGSVSGLRIYIAGFDSDMVTFSKGVPKERDNRVTIIEAYDMVRERFSSNTTFIK